MPPPDRYEHIRSRLDLDRARATASTDTRPTHYYVEPMDWRWRVDEEELRFGRHPPEGWQPRLHLTQLLLSALRREGGRPLGGSRAMLISDPIRMTCALEQAYEDRQGVESTLGALRIQLGDASLLAHMRLDVDYGLMDRCVRVALRMEGFYVDLPASAPTGYAVDARTAEQRVTSAANPPPAEPQARPLVIPQTGRRRLILRKPDPAPD